MMADVPTTDHPFTYTIELHPQFKDRFCWTIMQNGEDLNFSADLFDTWQQAETDAYRKMKRLVTIWGCGQPR
jgi:hypothetical protein